MVWATLGWRGVPAGDYYVVDPNVGALVRRILVVGVPAQNEGMGTGREGTQIDLVLHPSCLLHDPAVAVPSHVVHIVFGAPTVQHAIDAHEHPAVLVELVIGRLLKTVAEGEDRAAHVRGEVQRVCPATGHPGDIAIVDAP